MMVQKQPCGHTKGVETLLKLLGKENQEIAKKLLEKAFISQVIVHQKTREGRGVRRGCQLGHTDSDGMFGGEGGIIFCYVLKYSQSGFYKI